MDTLTLIVLAISFVALGFCFGMEWGRLKHRKQLRNEQEGSRNLLHNLIRTSEERDRARMRMTELYEELERAHHRGDL